MLDSLLLVDGDGVHDGELCLALERCSLSCCGVTVEFVGVSDGVFDTLVGVIGGGRLGGTGL